MTRDKCKTTAMMSCSEGRRMAFADVVLFLELVRVSEKRKKTNKKQKTTNNN